MSEPNQRDSGPEQKPSSTEGNAPLPSIIIDPSLTGGLDKEPSAEPAAAAAPASAPAPEAAPAPRMEAAPDPNVAPPPPGFIELQGDISLADAEHFASSFRPSWEPAVPPAHISAPIAQASTSIPSVPVAAPSDDELPLPQLPGQRAKRRATLLTLGAVGFFGLMLVLALRSSTHEPPPGATPTTNAATPTAASTPAATTDVAPAPTTAPATAAPAPAPAPAATDTQPAPATATATPTPAPEPVPAAAQAAPATPEPAAAEAAPAAAPEPAPTPAPAPEPEPAPAPEPTTVRLRVTTSPGVAKLTLDGAPIANPFDASVPKGGKHELEASAVGHRSMTKRVSFDRDQDLTLHLRPEAARRSAQPSRAPRSSSPKSASAPEPPVLTIEKEAPKKTKGAAFVADSPY